MTFLNPALLLGLLGMAVPVIIHLLSRRSARRVEFSTLEFLMNLQRKSMRRVRIRQLLLLLVRMLLVAAIAFAMARPVLTSVSAGGGGSTSAVIVLDSSYSMNALAGDEILFEKAKRRAREVLRSLEEGDEVFLLAPGSEEGSPPEGVRDLRLLAERIELARAGGAAVDLGSVVEGAAALLEDSRYANREIHVISDFQASAWQTLSERELPAGIGLFLFPLGDGDPPGNAWVESVDFSGQILERGSPIEFRTVIASGPGFDPAETEVEMEVDGRVVDRRRIDLGPSSRVALTFRETFREDGLHFGKVTIRCDDALGEDDRRCFSLRTAREVPVLLVSGNPTTARYLQAALAPEGAAAGTFAVRQAPAQELVSASRDREAVVVLADVERLAEAELAGIKAFLSEGGGLLVFPGPLMDASAWGRSFLPKFLPGSLADLRAEDAPVTIAKLDTSHPLFDLFQEGAGGLRDVRFARTLQFRPNAGTAVLASYSTGEAAIVESSLLPGRVLFFTSSLDPTWSDLPLTGAFLPLVHEAVRYLSETGSKAAQELAVGEGASVWLPKVPPGGGLTLHAPDGATRTVGLEPGPGGYALHLPVANAPGFWVFESARGETVAAFAANAPRSESDLTRIDVEEVHERLKPVRSAVLTAEETLAKEVKEARVGREIGRLFLWAAAFLLLSEMVLAARIRKAASAEVGV